MILIHWLGYDPHPFGKLRTGPTFPVRKEKGAGFLPLTKGEIKRG
jgi:hypothetical protein